MLLYEERHIKCSCRKNTKWQSLPMANLYVCEGENFQEKIGSLYFEMNLPISKL